MKKIILAVTILATFDLAFANENTPSNFHKDKKLGQYNSSIKMNYNGDEHSFSQKICFVKGGLLENPNSEKLDPTCRSVKLKDTATDLEYIVTCKGLPDTRMQWKRISENEFTFQSKSSLSEMNAIYKYVGASCEADAIRK